MEEKDFLNQVQETFEVKAADPCMASPLVLAYVGDAVYDLMVRTILAGRGNSQVNALNSSASRVCMASAQAALADSIKELLTPEENAVYRRGRNAKSYTKAKNATMSDYRHATGLEALCGFLYLSGKTDRMLYLMNEGFRRNGMLNMRNKEKETDCREGNE